MFCCSNECIFVSLVIIGTFVMSIGGLEKVDEDKWGGENDSTKIWEYVVGVKY
jgi:hypothetical protein